MMSTKVLLTGLTLLLLLPLQTHAQGADSCRQRTNREFAREQRLYRAYLFGKRNAKDAPVHSVRYDKDGWAWSKTADPNTPWRNSHPDNQGLRWSNSVMDANDEHADILPLIGIFETKRVNTSELIPYLLQSIRAFECRLDALSEVIRLSQVESGDDPIDIEVVQPLGCKEFRDLQTWPECHFAKPNLDNVDRGDSTSYSEDTVDQLLTREKEMLKLAVEYDAGYRSLLQFAGNFDIFLQELRWPLSLTIRNAVGLIGQLERIPCFLSSCDAAPPARSE